MAAPLADLRNRQVSHLRASASGGSGVDLIETLPFLLLAYQEGAAVRVKRSAGGVAWTAYTVTLIDGALDSSPALAASRWDTALVLYHSDDAARIWRSASWGSAWTDHATHSGLRFPRAAYLQERLFLVAHDGSSLRVYSSADHGVTLSAVLATISMPEQPVCLRVDAYDLLRVYYRNASDNLVVRRSRNGIDWSSEAVLVAGDLPVVAYGLTTGLLTYYTPAGVFTVARLDETLEAIAATLAAPSGVGFGSPVGTLINRHGHYLLTGRDAAGDLETRFSTRGATWAAPT